MYPNSRSKTSFYLYFAWPITYLVVTLEKATLSMVTIAGKITVATLSCLFRLILLSSKTPFSALAVVASSSSADTSSLRNSLSMT
mmetsp:Transcript_41845/g.75390  ORF Transcript_41845/g.75390 Transcript_41845/m.75390 type:complete len:85 (+) Transcript_41845:1657-1911(+)